MNFLIGGNRHRAVLHTLRTVRHGGSLPVYRPFSTGLKLSQRKKTAGNDGPFTRYQTELQERELDTLEGLQGYRGTPEDLRVEPEPPDIGGSRYIAYMRKNLEELYNPGGQGGVMRSVLSALLLILVLYAGYIAVRRLLQIRNDKKVAKIQVRTLHAHGGFAV